MLKQGCLRVVIFVVVYSLAKLVGIWRERRIVMILLTEMEMNYSETIKFSSLHQIWK